METRVDRRTALVAAAFTAVARDGFEGLRTRDVARAAGVNVATLHYYFPTKEALIRGVIGHAMQRFTTTIPTEGSAVERLTGHLHGLVKLIDSDRELWTVMGELVLRAPRDPDLARTFQEIDVYWHRTVRDLISRCIYTGAVDSSLETGEAASLIISAIRGLSLPTVGGSDTGRTRQVFRQIERYLGLKEEFRL